MTSNREDGEDHTTVTVLLALLEYAPNIFESMHQSCIVPLLA